MSWESVGQSGTTTGPQVTMRTDFETFHRTTRADLVRTLTVAIGDLDLAEEAVDVALSRLWSRWATVADPAPWTYRVARNWATSWWRRRRRISTQPVPDVPVEDPGPSANPTLAAALASLSPDHRDVLALRFVADASVAETAAALSIATGTVKSRTARALQALRAAMEVAR